jgi:hypothetical protein
LKPGPVYAYNITLEVAKKQANRSTKGFGIELPNGRYLFTLHFFTKTDPYTFFLQWQLDVYNRLGEENFK